MENPILKRKKNRILKSRRKAAKEMTRAVDILVKEIDERERVNKANKILNKNHGR